MKKKLLVGLVTILFLAGMVGVASATFMISDVGITSNSVTFTIDGDMTGYSLPIQDKGFSLEYFGDIFLGDNSYAPNTWSSSVFDNETIIKSGYTGTWSGADYTWSHYNSSLANASAINRTITVSFTKNYLDPTAMGQIGFYWGNPLSRHIEIQRVDIGNSNPVPEPATMLLFGTGLAGLAGLRRRQAKK